MIVILVFGRKIIYRGTHLYEVASQWDSGILTVIDFDIEKMFPEYMRHYKRWAKYIGDKEIEDLEKSCSIKKMRKMKSIYLMRITFNRSHVAVVCCHCRRAACE